MKQSHAQGAGSSSRGLRDGAGESSGPNRSLGYPPHVEGRDCMIPRVRGTENDVGGDGKESLFPTRCVTDTRGLGGVSSGAPGLFGCQ